MSDVFLLNIKIQIKHFKNINSSNNIFLLIITEDNLSYVYYIRCYNICTTSTVTNFVRKSPSLQI